MRKELYSDGIGFVESFDFSKANMSQESRVETVTKVASVCFNKEAKNKIALFNMLESESVGLPSSAFEFVPVLIKVIDFKNIWASINEYFEDNIMFTLDIEKYGQWIYVDDNCYLLTNLRACLNDEKLYRLDRLCDIDFKIFFNTSPEEIQIIKDNFKVFYKKIPIFIARQFGRHRGASLQELSRRYTDDKKAPIEFYNKNKILTVDLINENCLSVYNYLIEKENYKPEDSRAVLPTAMYTNIWSAWLPDAYDNFIKLRTKKNAQSEIRDLANAMEGLR